MKYYILKDGHSVQISERVWMHKECTKPKVTYKTKEEAQAYINEQPEFFRSSFKIKKEKYDVEKR
jgi:hypothetical protein